MSVLQGKQQFLSVILRNGSSYFQCFGRSTAGCCFETWCSLLSFGTEDLGGNCQNPSPDLIVAWLMVDHSEFLPVLHHHCNMQKCIVLWLQETEPSPPWPVTRQQLEWTWSWRERTLYCPTSPGTFLWTTKWGFVISFFWESPPPLTWWPKCQSAFDLPRKVIFNETIYSIGKSFAPQVG